MDEIVEVGVPEQSEDVKSSWTLRKEWRLAQVAEEEWTAKQRKLWWTIKSQTSVHRCDCLRSSDCRCWHESQWILAHGRHFLPWSGANDLVALLKELPITASVQRSSGMIVSLRAFRWAIWLGRPTSPALAYDIIWWSEWITSNWLAEAAYARKRKLTDCVFSFIICQIRTMVVTC